MKPAHSPAPWHTDETGWVYDRNGETVVYQHPMVYVHKRKRANGVLIAAAPELLKLLTNILAAHDTKNNGAMMGEAVLCRYFAESARALITKATYISP